MDANDMRDFATAYMEREDWIQVIMKDIKEMALLGHYSICLDEDGYPEITDPSRCNDLRQYLRVKGFKVKDDPDGLLVEWGVRRKILSSTI